MRPRPISQRIVLLLVAGGVVLPITVCVVLGLGRLLAAMGDAEPGRVVDWIAAAFGVLWLVDVVCLILVLAINSLGEPDEPPEGE